MDLVTGRINDIVNCVNSEDIAKLDIANVLKIKTPPCRVELIRIKSTPTVQLPSLQMTNDLLALNEYFTRSKNKPKPKRKSRHPQHASTNIDYAETEIQSDVDKMPKQSRSRSFPPPADGPSQTRITSQDSSTVAPDSCLPPIETENPDDDNDPPSAALPCVTTNTLDPTQVKSKPKQKGKGTFAMKSFTLKKTKRKRNYGCKLCEAVLSSAHHLTVHHQEKHGILYCEMCNKAFNNPTSLMRHKYQHRELRFPCNCGAAFAFASQLQTHSVVHCRHATHHCVYSKCRQSFKNKGDLKRHVLEHTSKPHECPDCDYKNTDLRNLESHRLKHSDIKSYVCKKCGESFKYNTQLKRHLSKCTGIKRSNSLDY